MERLHLIIFGDVHGVGFRFSALEIARDLDLVGWVRNRPEGSVEIVAEGPKENLEKLRRYCEMDVIISKELYDFGLKNHFLKYKDKWNTPRIVNVNFSYPKDILTKKQIGLF